MRSSTEHAAANYNYGIGPGGYLQWQEVDVIDSWATPQTPDARSTISCIVSERLARGLTTAFVPTQSISCKITNSKQHIYAVSESAPIAFRTSPYKGSIACNLDRRFVADFSPGHVFHNAPSITNRPSW